MASTPSATAQPQLSEQAGKLRLQQGRLFTERDESKAHSLSLWEEMAQVKHESKTRRWEAVQTDRPSEMGLNRA